MQFVAILCGLFCIAGAALEWEWFMNHRKAEFWVRVLGYQGTRLFYIVLGAVIVVLGATVCGP